MHGGRLLGIKLIDVLDLYNVALVPALLFYRLADEQGLSVLLSEPTTELLAQLSGILQVHSPHFAWLYITPPRNPSRRSPSPPIC